jgi:hypothetical protein
LAGAVGGNDKRGFNSSIQENSQQVKLLSSKIKLLQIVSGVLAVEIHKEAIG